MNVYKTTFTNFIRYDYSKYFCYFNRHKFLSHARSLTNSKCYEFCYKNILLDSVKALSSQEYVKDVNEHPTLEKILLTRKIDNFTEERGPSLLQFCNKFLPNKPLDFRIDLYIKIFKEIEGLTFSNVDEYNLYIKICTKNEIDIEHNLFLNTMKCEANEETFKLLLENVGNKGDTNRAYEILSKMKANHYVADERVFNALILAHTISSGSQGSQVVLNTMKAAQIAQSSDTNWCILTGLAIRNDDQEFINAIESLFFSFNDQYFVKILMKLGLNNNERLIKIVKKKFDDYILHRQLLPVIEELCLYLIYRSKADISVRIYCDFTEQSVEDEFCNTLLREILKAEVGPKEVLNICKHLKSVGRNELALEFVTAVALRSGQTEHAWFFLKHFNTLRPHYFWPLLLQAGKKNGEVGVIDTLTSILELNVNIDNETLERYMLPFCDISSPKDFLSRIYHLKINLRQLLTPLLVMLLRNNRLREAGELCDEFKVSIDANRLIRPVAMAFKNNTNTKDIVNILKRIYEANEASDVDYVGNVLLLISKLSKENDDLDKFLGFLKILHTEKLTISSLSADNIDHILQTRTRYQNKEQLEDVLDQLLDVSMNKSGTHISHPRNMTMDELECHLIELTNKNMETRGVLRRLIQAHGKLGNHQRIQQLKGMLETSGYKESPGMKATRLQTYIKTEQSQLALELLDELRNQHPNFDIDTYKIIDLATILLNEDKYEKAKQLLEATFVNRSRRGNSDVERNIVRLLHAAKNPADAGAMYELLVDRGFCEPTNVILGAVLKSYLKCDNLEDAVKYYESCCQKYKCTPLQIEILKHLVEANNKNLLTRAVNATATVYGIMKAQMALAVAFAETGRKESLKKLLMQTKPVSNTELQNRCSRLAGDGKLEALLILSEAAFRMPPSVLNVDIVNTAIVDIYDTRNDVEAALDFVNNLKENEITVSKKVTTVVENLIKRNKPDQKDRLQKI